MLYTDRLSANQIAGKPVRISCHMTSLRSTVFLVICSKIFVFQSNRFVPRENELRVQTERFFDYAIQRIMWILMLVANST